MGSTGPEDGKPPAAALHPLAREATKKEALESANAMLRTRGCEEAARETRTHMGQIQRALAPDEKDAAMLLEVSWDACARGDVLWGSRGTSCLVKGPGVDQSASPARVLQT